MAADGSASIATRLLALETREAALDALESHTGAHDRDTALAVASALTDVLCRPADEVGRATFRRAGLLRGRLSHESPTPHLVFGAAYSNGRSLAVYESTENVVGRLLLKPPEQLGLEDAVDYACMAAMDAPVGRYGWNKHGLGDDTFLYTLFCGNKSMVIGVRLRLAKLLSELLSQAVPQGGRDQAAELLLGGAWAAMSHMSLGGSEIKRYMIEDCNIFAIAAANLRAAGGASVWLRADRGQYSTTSILWLMVITLLKDRAGEADRPDVALFETSGLFVEALAGVRAFEAGGIAGVSSTDPGAFLLSMATLRQHAHLSAAAQAQLRGVASGLAFAMMPETRLDWFGPRGFYTDVYAGQVCASVFGRDEADSESTFVFTQLQVDSMIVRWHDVVSADNRGPGYTTKLSADAIQTLELCISDTNKPLLLANDDFLPYLLEALLLDPNHPRLSDPSSNTSWLQQMACECFAQLAMFPPGADALLRNDEAARVRPALESVVSGEHGRSAAARTNAKTALAALFPEALPPQRLGPGSPDGRAEAAHVMLSYNWRYQPTMKRLNLALKARDYSVWIDIEKMQGSTIEAMASAVEDAAVVCYTISQAYKESVNCRMEAQYAHQQQKDMLPLMLQEGHRPNG